MKARIPTIDPLRILVLVLMILPVLALFAFGVLWLWQNDTLQYWLMAMV